MKIQECRKEGIWGVGFIDPNAINEVTIRNHAKDTERLLLMFLKEHHTKTEILFPYNFE
jgi:hypothetical protein